MSSVNASGALNHILIKAEEAWDVISPIAKTVLHWGFIPAIIVVGMTCTEPKPTLGQLLGPM
jgi:import receptor subunit TOM7